MSSVLKQVKTLRVFKPNKAHLQRSVSIRIVRQSSNCPAIYSYKANASFQLTDAQASDGFRPERPQATPTVQANAGPRRTARRHKQCAPVVLNPLPQHSPTQELPPAQALQLKPTAELLVDLADARDLAAADSHEWLSKLKNLPQRKEHMKRKTLVLDLDETLVHCSDDGAGQTVTVYDESPLRVSVAARPHVDEVLRRLSAIFEVVVFTAARKSYADAVLEFLDPLGEYVHHRLYRDDCVTVDDVLVKDLRVLNRSLDQTVIVDNHVTSFARQLDNGIPIPSWRGSDDDAELVALLKYLESLADVDDVQAANRAQFGLAALQSEICK